MSILKSIAKGAVGIATVATGSLGGNNAKHYVQSKRAQSNRTNNPVQRVSDKPASGISIRGKR